MPLKVRIMCPKRRSPRPPVNVWMPGKLKPSTAFLFFVVGEVGVKVAQMGGRKVHPIVNSLCVMLT